MEQLIDVTYFMADRQDATVSFVEKRPQDVAMQVARLPGVLAAEPYREVPVRIRNGSIERRVMISGGRATPISAGSSISICVPLCFRKPAWRSRTCWRKSSECGQAILSKSICWKGSAGRCPSDRGTGRGLFRHQGMMDAEALARLMREAPAANSVNLSLDRKQRDEFYAAIKSDADRERHGAATRLACEFSRDAWRCS